MANSIAELQAQNGQATAPVDLKGLAPKDQVKHLLNQYSGQIREALPKHLSADRLLRVAQTAAVSTPKLLECYVPTLLGAVMQSAALGLEPNTVLGHSYLVPYRNRKKKRQDCQLIIGYKGFIDMARRSGQVVSVAAYAVREQDFFEYQYGLNEKLNHKPAEGERGAITHFYAYATMKGGGHAFEVMTDSDVRRLMATTQSKGDYGPWKDHYEEMGRKTVFRKLAKWLPLSVDLATAVALDEKAEAGKDQSLDGVLDGDYEVLADTDSAPDDDGGNAEETPSEWLDGGGDESADGERA